MTTSEIMVGIEGSKYAALRPESDVREALLANLANQMLLIANFNNTVFMEMLKICITNI